MNKFKYYFILSITTLSLFSCSKNDTTEITPPRDYAAQYATDITDSGRIFIPIITVSDKFVLLDDQMWYLLRFLLRNSSFYNVHKTTFPNYK
jgi:hypothetical protein